MRLISIALLMVSLVSGSVKGQPTHVSLERLDSALVAQAWDDPDWYDVNDSLVAVIRERLAREARGSSYSPRLVYFSSVVAVVAQFHKDGDLGRKARAQRYGLDRYQRHYVEADNDILRAQRYYAVHCDLLAVSYFRLGMYDSSYFFAKKAEQIFKRSVDRLSAEELLSDIGMDLLESVGTNLNNQHLTLLRLEYSSESPDQRLARYNEALSLLLKADSLYERYRDHFGRCYPGKEYDERLICLLHLADIYGLNLNDTSRRNYYFKMADSRLTQCPNDRGMAQALSSRAVHYYEQRNYNQAKQFSRKTMRLPGFSKLSDERETVFRILTRSFIMEDNYDSARKYMMTALADTVSFRDNISLTSLLADFCSYALLTNHTDDLRQLYPILRYYTLSSFPTRYLNSIERQRQTVIEQHVMEQYDKISAELNKGDSFDSYLFWAFASFTLSLFSFAFYRYKRSLSQ